MRREIRLPLTASGRLDRALADALGLGRAAVKRAFALGEVRVRGRRARASDPAAPGALVELDVELPAGPPEPEPDAPLSVLLERPRYLVVEKPAGVAVHPLAPGEGGTLANAVAARHPECAEASPEPREGGAVQRLDLETSGCVLFARDPEAWEALHAQLGAHTVDKVYLALAVGRLPAGGVCSVPLAQRGGRVVPAPDVEAEERLQARGLRPRPAETHYEPERRFADHTLLRVRIVTGVMHQIRAHLALLGHPVAGDALYGGAAAALPGLERQFLHAWRLAFDDPDGAGRVAVESPLPPELEAVLARLPAAR
ncbi:pseudouridine synthase, RluA family [Anaeromyxobacter dehalogenans 2CP-1]|uniref:Pseudouridine synthase, RluA family n=1 Tax=Anaeromyxobacter dehalogenans (strain ATCC BAA-258 / DSM 21875 / 2CP-1) TaxID=455488 RepID=B8J9U3_ANAD2|nr:RluA family pseudouridine synthase [Anaeromyxobacter dehalogenans]ACL63646.1 pseudouridine synthase, RluA family [Anaeromyxobacter dehalogenans 2CP-1]